MRKTTLIALTLTLCILNSGCSDSSSIEPADTSSSNGTTSSPEVTTPTETLLIACTDCGKTVSKRASACPHCGAPVLTLNTPEAEPEMSAEDQYNRGLQYEKGDGVPQNFAAALKWYRMAAIQGNVNAQLILGYHYLLGNKVTEDATESTKWFQMAAEQGNVDAQFYFGRSLVKGFGIPQNYNAANKWLSMAAEQGHAEAQYNLGVMYLAGMGVKKDEAEAYMWLSLAFSLGHKEAREAGDLAKESLSAEQLARAQSLATEMFKQIKARQK